MKKIIRTLVNSFSNKQKGFPKEYGKCVKEDLSEFEKNIGYAFKDISILRIALTHTSCYYRNEELSGTVSEYERMEFLGDSILGFVAAEYIFSKYSDKKEGFLSKLKSQVVSENYLSIKAKAIHLGDYIILGDDELRDKGNMKKSILSNMMESVICAIYFDGGLRAAKKFIINHILEGYSEELNSDVHINYKSKLQEYSQSKYKKIPEYEVTSAEGPDHKKVFTIDVYVNDKLIGSGKGFTKKTAEQNAAKKGCKQLNI